MLDRLKQQSLEARVPLAYDQLVGISAARYAKALAIGKNDFNAACSWAAGQNWRSTPNVFASLHKAAVGPMTPDEFVAGTAPSAIAEDLLAAVRPTTLIDRIPGFAQVPLNTSLLSIAGSATAHWIGINQPKKVSKFSLVRVTVLPYKVAALVIITREVLLNSSPAADVTLAREMQRALSEAVDVAFIDLHTGPVADEQPGSITYGATTINSTGSTLTAVSNDLADMIESFSSGRDEALVRAVFVMSPTTATYLAQLRGTGGGSAYPDIGPKGGLLLGIPVFTSGACTASGSPGESNISLIDPSQVLVADPRSIELQLSENAALQIDDDPLPGATTVRSLWQNNLVGILVERWLGFQRGSDQGVIVLTNVSY